MHLHATTNATVPWVQAEGQQSDAGYHAVQWCSRTSMATMMECGLEGKKAWDGRGAHQYHDGVIRLPGGG